MGGYATQLGSVTIPSTITTIIIKATITKNSNNYNNLKTNNNINIHNIINDNNKIFLPIVVIVEGIITDLNSDNTPLVI